MLLQVAGRDAHVSFRAPWANADGAGIDGINYALEYRCQRARMVVICARPCADTHAAFIACRLWSAHHERHDAMWTTWTPADIDWIKLVGCDVRAVATLPAAQGHAQLRYAAVRYAPSPGSVLRVCTFT